MNFRKTLLALSVLGATAGLGLSGCGGSSHKHPETSAVLEATEALEAALVDAAKSGTVVTVADGYAFGCLVQSGTLTAQEISQDTALGQYLFLGDPAASLTATGCTDKHTGVSLPPLSAPIPTITTALDAVIITPITTVVQSFVAAGNSLAAAQTATTALTGVAVGDLDADPVVSTEPTVQKAVAKVVAIANLAAGTNPIDSIVAAANADAGTPTLVSAATTVNAAVAAAAAAVDAAIDSIASSGSDLTADVAEVVAVASADDAVTDLTDETAVTTATAALPADALDTDGLETTEVTSATVEAVAETIVEAIVDDIVSGETDLSEISNDESVTDAAGDLEDAVTDTGDDFGGTGGTGGTSGI